MPRLATGLQWLDRRLARRAPVLDAPPPPLCGGLGVLPPGWPPVGAYGPVIPVPPGRAPELTAGEPWHRLHPAGIGPTQRRVWRLGWLVAYARLAAMGDDGARERALEGLERWLAEDRPGRGPGWVHTTDLTARLCHLLASLAWLGPAVSPDLRERIAGSASLHLAHLEDRLIAPACGDPRRFFQLVGLAVGGLGWPALPQASGRVGRASSALPGALEALLDDDGAPRDGSLGLLPELLAHGTLLAELGRANSHPLPRAVVARLRSAAQLLEAAFEPRGGVPGSHDRGVEPLLPLEPGRSAAAALAACAELGWISGSVEPPDSRTLRSFRACGLVIGVTPLRSGRSRLLFQLRVGSGLPGDAPSFGSVLWGVDQRDILAAPHPARRAPGLGANTAHLYPAGPAERAELLRARLTERELCVRARASGGGQGLHSRQAVLQGHRLMVDDVFEPPRGGLIPHARPPRVRVGWQLGPSWSPSWEGEELVAQSAGATLRVSLDPALTWSLVRGLDTGGGWAVGACGEPVAATQLLGEGPLFERTAIRCSFSLS